MKIKVEYKKSYSELLPSIENGKIHFNHVDKILNNLKAEGIL